MTSRQKQRSEMTKQAILDAATALFSQKKYHQVTMREIARQAHCSHTTIFLYFKDKEDLLCELAIPMLDQLKAELKMVVERTEWSLLVRLKEISMAFVKFSLRNRSLYDVIFLAEGSNVEETAPKLAVNQTRIALLDMFKELLRLGFGVDDESRLIQYGRIYFYMLNGMISTYIDSQESYEDLLARLEGTFEESIDIMLQGFQVRVQQGGEEGGEGG